MDKFINQNLCKKCYIKICNPTKEEIRHMIFTDYTDKCDKCGRVSNLVDYIDI